MSRRHSYDGRQPSRRGRPIPPRLETSAGGVVFRRAGQGIRLLLIRDPYSNWGLPKGHVEKGETPEEAAIREVGEETGLRALRTVARLSTIDWYFRDHGQPVHKFCHFFLLESAEGEAEPQAEEGISACIWLPPAEALRTISYDNARRVLQEALLFFGDSRHPDAEELPGHGHSATEPATMKRTGDDAGLLTIPNAVTALRIPLAFAFVVADTVAVRAAILAAAAASDWVDGWLARWLGQHSRAGELLDPLADKVFVLAALLSFAIRGAIQPWELLVLISRDLYASIAFFIARLRGWPIRFRARTSGKVVTALQIAAILVLLLRPAWSVPFVLTVGAAAAYAIVDYTRAGLRSLRERRTSL